MKHIFFLSLILLVSAKVSAQFTKAELQVAGLTCSMCSRATDKQLRTLDFIEDIDIDLSHASFVLHFKKDKAIDFYQIKKKVEDAGFSVASLKPFFTFTNMKVEKGSSFTWQKDVFYFTGNTSQILNGVTAFKIIDKGFVPEKESKKYASEITGTESSAKKTESSGSRIYHITL